MLFFSIIITQVVTYKKLMLYASTNIRFALPRAGHVRLAIHDNLGREVKTVVAEPKVAGQHQVTVDMSNLVSGVYFYRLQVGDFGEMKKMIFLRSSRL